MVIGQGEDNIARRLVGLQVVQGLVIDRGVLAAAEIHCGGYQGAGTFSYTRGRFPGGSIWQGGDWHVCGRGYCP